MKRVVASVALLLLSWADFAFARLVNLDEANLAVQRFFQHDAYRQRQLNGDEIAVQNIAPLNHQREEVGFLVTFRPRGFALVSGLTELNPIKFISYDNEFEAVQDHVFIQRILEGLLVNKRALGYAPAPKNGAQKQLLRKNRLSLRDPQGSQQKMQNGRIWENLLAEHTMEALQATESQLVAPLLRSRWDQGSPYNIYTPTLNGKHTWIGCSATSQAQLMYYWKYPEFGRGGLSYRWQGRELIADFQHRYAWDLMLDVYGDAALYSQTQLDAIGRLLSDIGAALEMDYGLEVSSAMPNWKNELATHFRFSSDISHLESRERTSNEMFAIVRDQIDKRWPVLLTVFSQKGGHSVVADGYRTDVGNLVHLNMGWSGLSDAFYALDNVLDYTEYESLDFNIRPDSEAYSETVLPPLQITAEALSSSEIQVRWQCPAEAAVSGFRVQRWMVNQGLWTTLGNVSAGDDSFIDSQLMAKTTYRYRVQTISMSGSSSFAESQDVQTLEPDGEPVGLSIDLWQGPAGADVHIRGQHLEGVTRVTVGDIPVDFKVLSPGEILLQIPHGLPDGEWAQVQVIAGKADEHVVFSSLFLLVPPEPVETELIVPVVVSAPGLNGSFFSTELTVANKGLTRTEALLEFRNQGGTLIGRTGVTLGAQQQRIIPDLLTAMKSAGILNSGDTTFLGTLRIHFSGLYKTTDASALARITSPVEKGRAGMAITALLPSDLLNGTSYLCGLRQNSRDRTNVALQNAGDSPITLHVTVFSGTPGKAGISLPEVELPSFGFLQYSSLLDRVGFAQGFVRVERTAGTAPYYAFGVINDQVTADGSLLSPLPADDTQIQLPLTLPVAVESTKLDTELVLTNLSTSAKALTLSYVYRDALGIQRRAERGISLEAGQQVVLPSVVNWFRQAQPQLLPEHQSYAGSIFLKDESGRPGSIYLGARTTSGAGGGFGMFYPAVAKNSLASDRVWISGLRQNTETRSHLALVNAGESAGGDITLRVSILDGNQPWGGNFERTLKPGEWIQLSSFLAQPDHVFADAIVIVERISGSNPFIAYGVINDGEQPGQRTDDAALILAHP